MLFFVVIFCITVLLEDNNLHGIIPSEIGNLNSLTWLWLHDNKFTGSIPLEMKHLKNVAALYLDDNLLTGTIPNIFHEMTELWSLCLDNNQLHGPIPSSLWNLPNVILLRIGNNDVTGTVPDTICEKVNKEALTLDDSLWFVEDVKVTCTCCGERGDCYMWDNEDTLNSNNIPCPTANLRMWDFYHKSAVYDVISNATLSKTKGNQYSTAQFCLSPTGCYRIEFFNDVVSAYNKIKSSFNISYSQTSNNLEDQDTCDTVNICGTAFDANHPRRAALNHLTQVAVPFWNETNAPHHHEALCWMLTKDQLFDDYKICDGTLLQRYIIILFFFQSQNLRPRIDAKQLSRKPTCDWDLVSCDDLNAKFVEKLDFSNQNLIGTVPTEIGLLKTLQNLNLSHNALSGTINVDIFTILPNLNHLDLSANEFEGDIPINLLQMNTLRALILRDNRLVGTLSNAIMYPEQLGEQHFLDLFLFKFHLVFS